VEKQSLTQADLKETKLVSQLLFKNYLYSWLFTVIRIKKRYFGEK